MTLDDLRRANLGALDEIYASDAPVAVPAGRYRGVYLQPVEGVDARRVANRVMVRVGFRTIPFGLDFDARCWWFGLGRARIGRFEPLVATSRWRQATVLQLRYDASRLPALVRRHLYDEVKPLGPELCLGIGGLNRPAGQGALFYFALVPS
jgi:hypothetical protein